MAHQNNLQMGTFKTEIFWFTFQFFSVISTLVTIIYPLVIVRVIR